MIENLMNSRKKDRNGMNFTIHSKKKLPVLKPYYKKKSNNSQLICEGLWRSKALGLVTLTLPLREASWGLIRTR